MRVDGLTIGPLMLGILIGLAINAFVDWPSMKHKAGT